MNGTPMVPSRYPTLIGQNLVEPTKQAIGFRRFPGCLRQRRKGSSRR
jgi:hypothetical protein